jgi:hexokinase
MALNAGTLIKWVKGFANEDAVGRDVVQMLQEAFQRQVGGQAGRCA